MSNTLAQARTQAMLAQLEATLQAHDWNVTQTAVTLGVHRTYIHKLMRRLGLRRPSSHGGAG